MFPLLVLTLAATLMDLKEGRIPNGIVISGLLCGLVYQVFSNQAAGVVLFFGGILLPLALFGILYYFRMTGAGDIKLLCMVGGFLGPVDGLICAVLAVLFGGVIAVCRMLRSHNFWQRLNYFSEYVTEYSVTRQWKSYLSETDESAKFCFSVPVLFGVLCYLGGIF